MLKSSRNRPQYFLKSDLEQYQELLTELDALMKLHVQQFFAQKLNHPKYHKQVHLLYRAPQNLSTAHSAHLRHYVIAQPGPSGHPEVMSRCVS